jgi:WD40 repeat protein
LTSSADGTALQWNARGQLVEPPYDRHGTLLMSAVYSPDGQWVASAGADRTIRSFKRGAFHQDRNLVFPLAAGIITAGLPS